MSKQKIFKIIISVIVILIILCTSGIIYVDSLMNNISYTDFSDSTEYKDDEIELDTSDISNDFFESIESVEIEDIEHSQIEEIKVDKKIVNVLLIGIDKQGGGNGRTDSMMIATLNSKTNQIKLTSIMRDMYVQIPNHRDNRINAAYSFGGANLLKETISLNFGIEIDGIVEVDFESFQDVIDLLGGVDIELTATEAKYLNDANYVTDENSYLVEGINHLNGNQALGYARIRKVKEIDGENNDFGRTARQRRILITLFNTYKNQNIIDLLATTEEILKIVKTDLSKEQILNYARYVLTNNIDEIETLRLPLDNGYKGALIDSMQVIVPDWTLTIETLYNFIYGDSSSDPEPTEKIEVEKFGTVTEVEVYDFVEPILDLD